MQFAKKKKMVRNDSYQFFLLRLVSSHDMPRVGGHVLLEEKIVKDQ